MDRLLKRYLKSWAAQQEAPENARAHLLLLAASRSYPFDETPSYGYEEAYRGPKEFYDLHVSEPSKVFDLIWVFHLPMPALRMI